MTARKSPKRQKSTERFTIVDRNGIGILSTDTDLGCDTPTQSDLETNDNESDYECRLAEQAIASNGSFFTHSCPPRPPPHLRRPHKDSDKYSKWCSEYMDFTNENPSTYHAIAAFSQSLKDAGFEYKSERKPLDILPSGGAYFVRRGGKALVAFLVGANWNPLKGVGAVGSHVDALCAKLKPFSVKNDVKGYNLLGVAPYSGALNLLWLDRDLGIAGSVLVRGSDGKIHSKLISSGRHPICRIPSLAPHFGAAAAPPYNKETQMVPVMGYGTHVDPPTADECSAPLYGKHSLALLRYICELANCRLVDLLLVDLDLYDVQPACRGGLSKEFMFAPRIDDRLCSFSALNALIEVKESIDFENWDGFSAVLLADNEEIGSATRTGAKGKMLNSVVERVIQEKGFGPADVSVTFANSLILSADVTHALNPNFTADYLNDHAPFPNVGLTLKLDANGHVMTDLTGVVAMEAIAKKSGLTLQRFHIRNDHPSGGTIGPMLAVDTGSRVVDVGLAQLSMHSIRASCGYKEAGLGVETFAAFFKEWRDVMDTIDYL